MTRSQQHSDITAFSGTHLRDITVEAAVAGRLSTDDYRIHPGTLRAQAVTAEQGGNPQLGANLRRAAELSTFEDAELLSMYDLLRPGRASESELADLRERLLAAGATTCADLVAEAHAVYVRRGLLRR